MQLAKCLPRETEIFILVFTASFRLNNQSQLFNKYVIFCYIF